MTNAGASAAPRSSLGDDDLAPTVVPAVGADAVRQAGLTALRAWVQGGDVETVMGDVARPCCRSSGFGVVVCLRGGRGGGRVETLWSPLHTAVCQVFFFEYF